MPHDTSAFRVRNGSGVNLDTSRGRSTLLVSGCNSRTASSVACITVSPLRAWAHGPGSMCGDSVGTKIGDSQRRGCYTQNRTQLKDRQIMKQTL